MKITNFFQILCRDADSRGENISGIFDTLVSNRGKTRFSICVFCSQLEGSNDIDLKRNFRLNRYYYRIVLRYLNNASIKNSYRIDSGFLWDDEAKPTGAQHQENNHSATTPGSSERLTIVYEFDFNTSGNYEVDLYVKKVESDDDFSDYEKISVKELELVAVSPIQVIAAN